MVNQTSRLGLDTYSSGESWDHTDAVEFVDEHTELVVSKTADYTATNYEVVLVDASGGAVTITLPSPDTDIKVTVKKTDSSANAVTIATPGSETIDGQSSITITAQYASRTIVSDGTNYFIQ